MNNKALIILITAATPVAELRAAIPLGLAWGLPVLEVWILAVIGNIIPIPFILLGANFALSKLKKIPKIHDWLQALIQKQKTRLYSEIKRWGWLGLFIFVAIPLPGTGAWTGSLAATVLGLKFWPSFLIITGGVIVASIIVTMLGVGIIHLF